LAKARVGIRFNDHLQFDDGEVVFNHARRMVLEGIVSNERTRPFAPAARQTGSR
jgi:hypothetical protein